MFQFNWCCSSLTGVSVKTALCLSVCWSIGCFIYNNKDKLLILLIDKPEMTAGVYLLCYKSYFHGVRNSVDLEADCRTRPWPNNWQLRHKPAWRMLFIIHAH